MEKSVAAVKHVICGFIQFGPELTNSLIPHPLPPILKVSISVPPRDPSSMPECRDEPSVRFL